jgi:hypothetical protein
VRQEPILGGQLLVARVPQLGEQALTADRVVDGSGDLARPAGALHRVVLRAAVYCLLGESLVSEPGEHQDGRAAR